MPVQACPGRAAEGMPIALALLDIAERAQLPATFIGDLSVLGGWFDRSRACQVFAEQSV